MYLIHASDGNIPSDMSLGEPGGLDEERRLLYVALTRARDRLTVFAPQRFYHRRFGSDAAHSYAPVSRFLEGEVGDAFDRTAVGSEADDDRAAGGPIGADPVGHILDALWS